MGKKFSPAAVGAFVVGAVVLAVVAVVVFGSGRFFRTTYKYIMYFTGDVNGLNVGAPVKLKGVEIGSVAAIKLNMSQVATPDSARELRIPVLIEIDAARLAEKGAIRPLTEENIQRLIERGLRGQLATQSFVTGLLYVKLDFFPDAPLNLVNDPTVPYHELPTIPTPLEEAQAKAAEFLAKLDKADLAGMVESLHRAVDGLDQMLNSPNLKATLEALPGTINGVKGLTHDAQLALQSIRKLSDNLDATLGPLGGDVRETAAEARDALHAATVTLEQLQRTLKPDGPVFYSLSRSLADLSAAARAVRQVSEELERNPSVLLRGKATDEEESK